MHNICVFGPSFEVRFVAFSPLACQFHFNFFLISYDLIVKKFTRIGENRVIHCFYQEIYLFMNGILILREALQ